MTRQQLFAAIGELDERSIAHSKREKFRSKRILWRVVAAAVVVVSLIGTAVAAPYIIGLVTGGKTELAWSGRTERAEDGTLTHHSSDQHGIWLDVELGEEERPIENYYFLDVTEKWTQVLGVHDSEYHTVFTWSNVENENEWLHFEQTAGWVATAAMREEEPFDLISTPRGQEITAETVTIGDMTALRIDKPPFDDGICSTQGERRLYWTDGTDVFMLGCSYETSDEEMTYWVNHLCAIEDITSYLFGDESQTSKK